MEENKETVVAVIQNNETDGENYVSVGVGYKEEVQHFKITDDDAYAEAGKLGSKIKGKTSEVTEFFKPLKAAAHQAHKKICDREKEVLKPFVEAEKTIKRAMNSYLDEKEKKRRSEEAYIKKMAQQSLEESINKATELEANGKIKEAEEAMEEAIIAENFQKSGASLPVQSAPTVKGVSTTKDYEIVSVDSSKVPIVFNGVEIRPVDMSAVKKLIKNSKGTIEIEGIEYREVNKVSLRKGGNLRWLMQLQMLQI